METRANYTIIGAFTLLVLAGAFGFVYWFMRPLTSDNRRAYEIVYEGTVSGLRQGNSVTFNGIPVGQVASLGLLPDRPNEVLVRVDVDANVPVLSDVRAGLESQGLTGIVIVSLRGGEPGAKPLPSAPTAFRAWRRRAARAWPASSRRCRTWRAASTVSWTPSTRTR
jgi:phospholipid/cholesterol/gamma-HCH transport system substrate-binding protein